MKQVAILVLGLFLASCTGQSGKTSDAVQTGTIQNLNTDEFDKKLKESNNRILLDVRTSGEYESGHIQGATNINVNDDAFEAAVSKLDTSKPVFVYCLVGGRSARAAEILQGMGFKTIYNLEGGMGAWNGAGKQVEKGAATAAAKGMTKLEFDKLVLHGDTLVLVDFNAGWCVPCKKILEYIPELEKEFAGKLIVVQVDFDANMDLARELKVNSVPYLFLIKGGVQQWEHPGFAEKSEVKKAIENVLNKK